MLNYITSFFRPGLLFNLAPSSLEGLGLNIVLIVFGVIIILGIVTRIFLQSKKGDKVLARGLKRIKNALYTMGILGFIYAFFSYQGARLLSARFWFPLLLLILAFWLYFPIKYIMVEVPKLREDIKNRKEFERYLP